MTEVMAPFARQKAQGTLVYAMHDAFRRDAALLMAAADARRRVDRPGVWTDWHRFRKPLSAYCAAEETVIWPVMRARLGADGQQSALLDAMESSHAELRLLMDGVEIAMVCGGGRLVHEYVERFCRALLGHIDHEEAEVLPLALGMVGSGEWALFEREQRRRMGENGTSSWFYPWLLDSAPPSTQRKVLSVLPLRSRLVFRAMWRRRYEQRARR